MEKVLEMERMRLDLERSYHRLLRTHGSISYGPGQRKATAPGALARPRSATVMITKDDGGRVGS